MRSYLAARTSPSGVLATRLPVMPRWTSSAGPSPLPASGASSIQRCFAFRQARATLRPVSAFDSASEPTPSITSACAEQQCRRVELCRPAAACAKTWPGWDWSARWDGMGVPDGMGWDGAHAWLPTASAWQSSAPTMSSRPHMPTVSRRPHMPTVGRRPHMPCATCCPSSRLCRVKGGGLLMPCRQRGAAAETCGAPQLARQPASKAGRQAASKAGRQAASKAGRQAASQQGRQAASQSTTWLQSQRSRLASMHDLLVGLTLVHHDVCPDDALAMQMLVH
eukprot:359937-Chlamydomonas_euryale.AAC.18